MLKIHQQKVLNIKIFQTIIIKKKQSRKQKKKKGKELYGYFKRQNKEITHEMTRILRQKDTLKTNIESLLIKA